MSQISNKETWLNTLAESLFTAERERRPIEPLTETFPELDLNGAYRIQQINIERRIAAGETLLGHKVGLTARTMQEMFGVDEPDYGHLLNTMFHEANEPLDLSELIEPQIEVEPAFVLGKRLAGPGLTADDVIEATDYISICFEVIDSRISNWRIKIQDTVADNGSSARVILGSKKVKPVKLALDNLETVLEIDGSVVQTGNTGAILGHPANSIAWLANKFAESGFAFEAGHIVLPGTCTRSEKIGGHKTVKGRIDELGKVSISLTGKPAIENKSR